MMSIMSQNFIVLLGFVQQVCCYGRLCLLRSVFLSIRGDEICDMGKLAATAGS